MMNWLHPAATAWLNYFRTNLAKPQGASVLVLLGSGLKPNEERYRRALESAGHRIVGEDSDPIQPHSVVAGLVSAEDAVDQLYTWRQRFERVRPILIGPETAFSDSEELILADAPTLSATADTAELLQILTLLSRSDGWLLEQLLRLDRNAKQLIADEFCEWVRSRPGIIGIVRLARIAPNRQFDSILRRLIEHAYTLLDGLPSEELSVQDVWNVTLLIAVPIRQSEIDRASPMAKSLETIARDLKGSRKLVLWSDRTVSDYFGPLGEGTQLWRLSSDDPLRQTLETVTANSLEREALEILFKSRLSQEDFEELLKALSNHND
jgi:hypothetical protein